MGKKLDRREGVPRWAVSLSKMVRDGLTKGYLGKDSKEMREGAM